MGASLLGGGLDALAEALVFLPEVGSSIGRDGAESIEEAAASGSAFDSWRMARALRGRGVDGEVEK